MMALAAALSKTTTAWAVGNGNGGLDTGAIAANTWYHVHLIKRVDTGVVDVLFSLSATAPTLPANYTLFRRIGSIRSDASSLWTGFTQVGDQFILTVPIQTYNAYVGLPATTVAVVAVAVPPGVITEAFFNAAYTNTASGNTITFFEGFLAASPSVLPGVCSLYVHTASVLEFGTFRVLTNSSGVINGYASAAGGTLYLATRGWVDRRGRDA
jgi:hypothetical protein